MLSRQQIALRHSELIKEHHFLKPKTMSINSDRLEDVTAAVQSIVKHRVRTLPLDAFIPTNREPRHAIQSRSALESRPFSDMTREILALCLFAS